MLLGGIALDIGHAPVEGGDGDVVAGALGDAIFGAAGLGGRNDHFPSTDPRFLNTLSFETLKLAQTKIRAKGFDVLNTDITVHFADCLRLSSHIDAMRQHLSEILQVPRERVNLKISSLAVSPMMSLEKGIGACAIVLVSQGV